MAPQTPDDWVTYLSRVHEASRARLEELDRYYEGKQPLAYLHPELLAELGEQLRQVVINWPRLVVDSLEERLDVEGFRFAVPGSTADEADADQSTSDELWRVWQANGMDEASQQAHVDAMVMGRAFMIVGSRDGDRSTPLITTESPLQVQADWDPQTRRVRAALKRWHETDPLTDAVLDRHATLYLPDRTVWYDQVGAAAWRKTDEDVHNLGVVPVVPLANRGRTLVPQGRTELADVIPLSDAACKVATDMMVSAEYHAMPRRVAFGFDEEDFTDEQGNAVSMWSRLAGRIWATAKNRKSGEDGDGADVIQFPEAQLTNFHETINALARLVASLAGMPPHFMGLSTDNPPSADAIKASEIRLIKRAERRQRAFGGGHEAANRLVLRLINGVWDPRALSLETVWRDPSTPTQAQKADAAVKLVQQGIIPVEQAREDLGYTAVQRERMRQMDEESLTRASVADLHALTTAFPPAPPAVQEQAA
ncbi:phage portal protein [Streptomyces sp. NBC_01477]|uniref:phage portal protein n=1 Tax=Streptomyces sp. NBC_01477 TaxID=2976015 RepID=UPI002E35FD49|nr:phage portal protein [Streptomyces sp. NBC_01477]